MKKKLISILMCAMIGIMPIGCGSSDKDDAKRSASKTEGKAAAQDDTAIDTGSIMSWRGFTVYSSSSATALAQFYTSQGQKITQEGNVLYAFVDGDTLEGSIISLAGTGAISDETVEAYVEMMKSFNGLVDYE